MRIDFPAVYRMSRREAASMFIVAFLRTPEKDRQRLVQWWNEDQKRKGNGKYLVCTTNYCPNCGAKMDGEP